MSQSTSVEHEEIDAPIVVSDTETDVDSRPESNSESESESELTKFQKDIQQFRARVRLELTRCVAEDELAAFETWALIFWADGYDDLLHLFIHVWSKLGKRLSQPRPVSTSVD